jgi:hypothetical protein
MLITTHTFPSNDWLHRLQFSGGALSALRNTEETFNAIFATQMRPQEQAAQ